MAAIHTTHIEVPLDILPGSIGAVGEFFVYRSTWELCKVHIEEWPLEIKLHKVKKIYTNDFVLAMFGYCNPHTNEPLTIKIDYENIDTYTQVTVWNADMSKVYQTIELCFIVGAEMWNDHLIMVNPWAENITKHSFHPTSYFVEQVQVPFKSGFQNYYDRRPKKCILVVSSSEIWILESYSKIVFLNDAFEVVGQKEIASCDNSLMISYLYKWEDKYAAIGYSNGDIELCDIPSRSTAKVLKGHNSAIQCLEGNSRALFSIEQSGFSIFMWNEQGLLIRQFEGHRNNVSCILLWKGLLWSCSSKELSIKVWPLYPPWQVARLMWIAWYKNQQNPECLIASLPKPVVKIIVDFLLPVFSKSSFKKLLNFFWK